MSTVASKAWAILPNSFRWHWRFLKLSLDDLVYSQQTVELFPSSDKRTVSRMTKGELHRLCDLDFDSKCLFCRGSFPLDELDAYPLNKNILSFAQQHGLLVQLQTNVKPGQLRANYLPQNAFPKCFVHWELNYPCSCSQNLIEVYLQILAITIECFMYPIKLEGFSRAINLHL